MDPVLRALSLYVALLILFRLVGVRSLSEATTFDFVLLLIIGEATQQALLGDDFSITNALIVIVTLMGADILLSIVKHRSPRVDELLDGMPVVIVRDGEMLKERTDKVRIDREDILAEARNRHGLERMDQIKYAVLERDGKISIIPK